VKRNVISELSINFALKIIKLHKYLCDEKHEYDMSRQVYRSGTSVGANIAESKNAQSKADYVSKLSIALKEADETEYWLDLLYATNYLDDTQYESINLDCAELIKLLTSIIKKLKDKDTAGKN
jgi:four helix bundle protein